MTKRNLLIREIVGCLEVIWNFRNVCKKNNLGLHDKQMGLD